MLLSEATWYKMSSRRHLHCFTTACILSQSSGEMSVLLSLFLRTWNILNFTFNLLLSVS